MHERPTPRLGGLGVLVGCFAPLVALFFTPSQVGSVLFATPLKVLGLVAGGLVIAALGAVDDIRGVRPRNKILVEVVVAVFAYACGFQIHDVVLPFVGSVHLGPLSLPVTVFWFLAIINALNLIDGLDGLATGVAFFACVSNFVVGYLNEAELVVLMAACLGGSLLGFLRYNFNPASIFLGDTGSLFLGYVLAATSLLGATVKSSTAVALLVPVIALGVPIMDTLLAMMRRALARQSMFVADRGHIHHKLLELGLTHRRAVLILYGLSVVLCGSAIAVSLGRDWQVGGAMVAVALVVVAVIRLGGVFDRTRLMGVRAQQRRGQVDRLRHAVHEAVLALHNSREYDHVLEALAAVQKEAPLESWRLLEQGEPGSSDPPPPIAGRLELDFTARGRHFSLRFVVESDLLPMGPDVRVLLEMVADGCAAAMTQFPVPKIETATQSVPAVAAVTAHR